MLAYSQPHHNYQQSISAHTSPTHTAFYGQAFNEQGPADYFGGPTTSYPDSPPPHALSPYQTPHYNSAAFPLHLPKSNEQNTARGLGVTHFPQPDNSSQGGISPTRQDSNTVRGTSPQRPQYNPAAVPFSSPSLDGHSTAPPSGDARVQDLNIIIPRGISAIRLSRPPTRRIQHSPPRRAFHEPSSPPKTPGYSRDVRLRDRLKCLHEERKQALANFCFSGKEVGRSQEELDVAWGSEVANKHMDELYVMQNQLTILMKQNCEYGKDWKRLGDEIDELFGDIMVPRESEVE